MPRSPFEILFDHLEDCDDCDYASRRVCLTGRLLFNAALKAARMIGGLDIETPVAKA